MNPTALNLHATIELHKGNTPIRPIIDWENAPAYELAKHLAKTLQSSTPTYVQCLQLHPPDDRLMSHRA
jgi:hypothetical protein